MNGETTALLAGAGLLGGAMNALAGGGSFVTLPAMIAAGVPSVNANASSTVALYPGGAASAWVYRDGLRPIGGVSIGVMLAVMLAGGLIGSLLLLWTPSSAFDHMLPWLLLIATLTMIFAPRLAPWLHSHVRIGPKPVLGLQLLLGIYAGFFGGAVGLMMLAVWSLLADADIKALNPTRMLMVTAANAIAALCFIVAGAIWWRETVIMGVTAVIGGYVGAVIGKKLDARIVRALTVSLSIAVTIAFFVRAFG